MTNLEKIIFNKLKELTYKNDTRADLTIDEFSKIFNDSDFFIKKTTKEILLAVKEGVLQNKDYKNYRGEVIMLVLKIITVTLIALVTAVLMRTNGIDLIYCLIAEFFVVYVLGSLAIYSERNK